nr:hypothetical protein BaRGS_013948 [Batillaria attramentaria]
MDGLRDTCTGMSSDGSWSLGIRTYNSMSTTHAQTDNSGHTDARFFFSLKTARATRETTLHAHRRYVPGSWSHLAAVYDGRKMKLYVNGVLLKVSVVVVMELEEEGLEEEVEVLGVGVFPEGGRLQGTLCDSPEVVLSYTENWQLRSHKQVRYRVVNLMNDDSSNPTVTDLQILKQHDSLNRAFRPYNISFKLDIHNVRNTTLRKRLIMFGCEPENVGDGICNPECMHTRTGDDGGDCDPTQGELHLDTALDGMAARDLKGDKHTSLASSSTTTGQTIVDKHGVVYADQADILQCGENRDVTKVKKRQLRKTAAKYTIREDVLYHDGILVAKRNQVPEILQEFHDNYVSGGHLGMNKTYKKVLERYFWHGMKQEVEDYCRSCCVCQNMNACRKKPAAPLHPIPVPKKKWSLVGMDIIGPLQVTDRGNQYIVALTDHFTKFPVAKAIPCKSSEEVARFMYETICIFGAFDSLITDQGREFINFALDILTDRFNINHRISSAYHPETNGQRERDNRTLKDTLVKITDNDDWDELLPAALFAYRTSVHKSTQFSPFLALYGEQAKLPFDVTGDANEQDLNEEIMDTMKGIHEEVKNKIGENISRAQKKQKEYYDSRRAYDHGFRIGDKVLIINAARVHRMGGKMAPRFVGPYENACPRSESLWEFGNEDGADSETEVKPVRRGYVAVDQFREMVGLRADTHLNVFFAAWTTDHLIGLATFSLGETHLLRAGERERERERRRDGETRTFGTDGQMDSLVHEIGHNFGLWHVHHGVSEVDCSDPCAETQASMELGDLCEDTSPTPQNVHCGDPGVAEDQCGVMASFRNTPFRNYMSYAGPHSTLPVISIPAFTRPGNYGTCGAIRVIIHIIACHTKGSTPKVAPVKWVVAADTRSVSIAWVPPLGQGAGRLGTVCSLCDARGTLVQFASSATSPAPSGITHWAPVQAIGPPDAEPCVPSVKAWMPEVPHCSKKFCMLELALDTPVVADRIEGSSSMY